MAEPQRNGSGAVSGCVSEQLAPLPAKHSPPQGNIHSHAHAPEAAPTSSTWLAPPLSLPDDQLGLPLACPARWLSHLEV